MSAKSATGSEDPAVQNWLIDQDLEYQLRLRALKDRLLDESLSHGSIELCLRCANLTAIGWGNNQPFSMCRSSFESTSPIVPNLRAFRSLRSFNVTISLVWYSVSTATLRI